MRIGKHRFGNIGSVEKENKRRKTKWANRNKTKQRRKTMQAEAKNMVDTIAARQKDSKILVESQAKERERINENKKRRILKYGHE